MTTWRYNRTFRQGLVALVFGVVLFGVIIALFIASAVQYNRLVAGMKTVEATIVDIDLDIHIKGPDEQEITITYEVDGATYRRELKTDTKISFEAGRGAHYAVGDKIRIFYDPHNPEVIASPRSMRVGIFYLIVSVLGLGVLLVILFFVIKNHRKFLVAQEEYEKEKEGRKKQKTEQKEQRKSANQEKYAMSKKIGKVILMVLAGLIGAFVCFHFFRGFFRGLG